MHLPSEMVHPPPKSTVPLYDLTREQAPPEDVQRLVFAQASQNTFFPSPLLLTAVALCYGALDGFYSLVRQSPFHSSRRCGNAGHSTASPPSRLWVPSSGQRQHTLAVLWEGRPPAPATQLLSLSLSLWLVVL
jgi:hypothetical protein